MEMDALQVDGDDKLTKIEKVERCSCLNPTTMKTTMYMRSC